MSADRRLDELTERLFAAGRAELPDAELLRRVELDQARGAAESAAPKRVSLVRWLSAAVVLAALGGVLLVLSEGSDGYVTMSAEAVRKRGLEASRQGPPSSHEPTSQSELVPPEGQGAPPAEVDVPDVSRKTRDPSKAAPPAPASDPNSAQSPLRSEIELLKSSRAALRAGDPGAALALLERHAGEAGGTNLGAEATLLRVEALAALGQHAEARALARRFVAENPNSPLSDRARNFMRDDAGQASPERGSSE